MGSVTSDDNDQGSGSVPIGDTGDYLIIEDHLQRVMSMLKSTEKTKNTVSRLVFQSCASVQTLRALLLSRWQLLSLLDLKQKQASIFQAKAAVVYSEQLADQARETAIQGRTLMLFTVVTILFVSDNAFFMTTSLILTAPRIISYHSRSCRLSLPLRLMYSP